MGYMPTCEIAINFCFITYDKIAALNFKQGIRFTREGSMYLESENQMKLLKYTLIYGVLKTMKREK